MTRSSRLTLSITISLENGIPMANGRLTCYGLNERHQAVRDGALTFVHLRVEANPVQTTLEFKSRNVPIAFLNYALGISRGVTLALASAM